MRCWGFNEDGSWGLLTGRENASWSAVSAGPATCGILSSENTVKCASYVDFGGYVPTEIAAVEFSEVASYAGACGRKKADSVLWCWWGYNHLYQTFP